MTAWVKCPSCGARNDFTVNRFHCRSCGAKLDLSRLRTGPTPGRLISHYLKRLLRMVVLVTLLVVLTLLVWPTTPEGESGSAEDGLACFEKLAELYEAIGEGKRLERIFTEAEVNGYFVELLAEAVPDGLETPRGLHMRAINLSFTEAEFIVHILAEWKVLRLTYEVAGQPRLRDGRFEVDVSRVSMGHLPVPGPLKQHFAGRLMPLFEQMDRERYVLDNLSQIDLRPGRARLRTGR
jgi:hypothetical protein